MSVDTLNCAKMGPILKSTHCYWLRAFILPSIPKSGIDLILSIFIHPHSSKHRKIKWSVHRHTGGCIQGMQLKAKSPDTNSNMLFFTLLSYMPQLFWNSLVWLKIQLEKNYSNNNNKDIFSFDYIFCTWLHSHDTNEVIIPSIFNNAIHFTI